MKQLVSIATIEKVIEAKQAECRVDNNTIITAAAVDLAEEHGIDIIKEDNVTEPIDHSQIFDSLKVLMGNPEFVLSMIKSLEESYRYETDNSGAKLIYGDSIQLFPQGSWKKQSLFSNIFGGLTIDFLETAKKNYRHRFEVEEFILLLEGKATFTMNGKKINAQQGDFLYFPKNTSMEITFDEVCKLLTIHPG
ncbi:MULTISPECIES: cupin domain-containing protein [Enterococcus]|jgi:ethanolamine utilization protein EutQ|uniref:cupin domain-containing protein n=1 Tax=Enterococcus TaxID=1350 RepID=UPI000A331A92|nr:MULTISPECIES: cupin domain-containing protein [Enterococcus]AXG38057.1 cupin domain-containing protein [Enterococcus gilvus]OTO77243.1 hypothetical protein A5865_001118 [Enterococcus sp. 12E11_DIV0728]OUZ16596.1 hypothetical protein A5868_001518 [Enterococcus sp. 12F9_DIV0723]